ncbi:MAG: hypothetical protein QOE91_1506 [Gaiellaceae bacterium]|jgi:hypothetical protein|nr:hypothetical protein [Gaiellaceae bacterium]
MKKALIAGALAFAALYPAAAGAATFKGTVVSRFQARHVLVVSSATGLVRSVHTGSAARVGAVVSVTAAKRADGTFTASRVAVVGRAHKARIQGVVLSRSHGMTFVSGNRSVIAVRSARRALASAGDTTPPVGAVANIGVTIGTQGALTQTSIKTVGTSSNIVIQATVASVTPATATTAGSLVLTVGTETFTIPLAIGTTLPATIVQGATVSLTISFGADGATASGDDENDDNDDQGDDQDENDDGSGSGSDVSSG